MRPLLVALLLVGGCRAVPREPVVDETPPPVVAPSPDPVVESMAARERLRREADTVYGRKRLHEAEVLLRRQELAPALAAFEDAWRHLPVQEADDRARTRRGLAETWYRRAIAFERTGDYDQALAAALAARNHGYVRADSLIRRLQRRLDR